MSKKKGPSDKTENEEGSIVVTDNPIDERLRQIVSYLNVLPISRPNRIEIIKYVESGQMPDDALILYLRHLWMATIIDADTTATPLELVRAIIRNRCRGTIWNLVDELLIRIISGDLK